MKILDYKVGTTFDITCTKEVNKQTNNIFYSNFQISKKFANIFGRTSEDVITVKATIIDEDVIIKNLYKDNMYNTNSIDYFGFIDFDKDGYNISMIYPNIKQYSICFPYGPDAGRFYQHDDYNYETQTYNHKSGDRRGMTVRLKIEPY